MQDGEQAATDHDCQLFITKENSMSHIPNLPQYQCHKPVRAAKIRGFERVERSATTRIWLEISPEHTAQVEVTNEWMRSKQPQVGGYFVHYEDGYTSYSPAGSFEDGYTRTSNLQPINWQDMEMLAKADPQIEISGVDIDGVHAKFPPNAFTKKQAT